MLDGYYWTVNTWTTTDPTVLFYQNIPNWCEQAITTCISIPLTFKWYNNKCYGKNILQWLFTLLTTSGMSIICTHIPQGTHPLKHVLAVVSVICKNKLFQWAGELWPKITNSWEIKYLSCTNWTQGRCPQMYKMDNSYIEQMSISTGVSQVKWFMHYNSCMVKRYWMPISVNIYWGMVYTTLK